MFVQTEITPNPNSLKFLPGKKVSNDVPIEITDKNESNNELIRNILSINGVTGIFLSDDFLSINKNEKTEWEDLKHIIISFINDYYSNGNEIVIDKESKSSSNFLNFISPPSLATAGLTLVSKIFIIFFSTSDKFKFKELLLSLSITISLPFE